MKANEMTFGVEIECTMPHGSVQTGGYHAGIAVSWLPAGWTASRDGSIVARGRTAVEFVSPVLRGEEGLAQVLDVVREIGRRGGKVNESCGLHVHVGFNKNNLPALAHLVALVGHHEHGIYAITGTKNRERSGWCKEMKRYGTNASYRRTASYDRYHLLNLATSHATVEFRAFAGTLNPVKIAGYVNVCLGLVEKAYAATRRATWSPLQFRDRGANGYGAKEATRLMKRLGWVKGGTPVGMLDTLLRRRVIAQFTRLAAQYDRQF